MSITNLSSKNVCLNRRQGWLSTLRFLSCLAVCSSFRKDFRSEWASATAACKRVRLDILKRHTSDAQWLGGLCDMCSWLARIWSEPKSAGYHTLQCMHSKPIALAQGRRNQRLRKKHSLVSTACRRMCVLETKSDIWQETQSDQHRLMQKVCSDRFAIFIHVVWQTNQLFGNKCMRNNVLQFLRLQQHYKSCVDCQAEGVFWLTCNVYSYSAGNGISNLSNMVETMGVPMPRLQ